MFTSHLPNYYENIIRGSSLPIEQRVFLAGLGRTLRLSCRERSVYEKTVVETSSSLLGPLVFLFVWWVLQRALYQNCQRLYFLARDGEILYKVAKVLVREWNLPIDLRYLYCSRESLLLPSLEKVEDFDLDWMTWGFKGEITWQEICSRLHLAPSSLAALLDRYELQHLGDLPASPIANCDRNALKKLLSSEEFAEMVRGGVEEKRSLTLSFMVQEGLAEQVKFALVDTGWRGSSQFALSRLLDSAGSLPESGLSGFYLGLQRKVFLAGTDSCEAFLFDWRKEKIDDRLNNLLCCEMLFSAQHGRTTGYCQNQKQVAPVLQGAFEEECSSWVQYHHDIAVRYADESARVLAFDELRVSAAVRLCRDLLRNFVCNPTSDQATVYGEWPMACEIREMDRQVMAPPMAARKFFKCALGVETVDGFWPQASLLRGRARFIQKLYNIFLATGLLECYRRFWLRY